MNEMRSVGVIGAGAWGTALATVAARAGRETMLWGRDATIVEAINAKRENPRYLAAIPLPETISATTDIDAAARCDLMLLAIPTQNVRPAVAMISEALPPETPVVTCAKGIERGTGRYPVDVLGELLPRAVPAILSGPSFASDVARGLPTAVTIAAEDASVAEAIATALSSATFRPYATDDMVGVEIGGALKNVLAIAAGAVAGRKLGKSAEAALIARGFAEIRRFAAAKGARSDTLMGLSGLGDVVLTCSSPQSRNYSFGISLGKGAAVSDLLKAGQPLAEGAFTAGIAAELARTAAIDMPITAVVAAIVEEGLQVDDAIAGLMSRPLRRETD